MSEFLNTPIEITDDGTSVAFFVAGKLDDAGSHISEFHGSFYGTDGEVYDFDVDMEKYRAMHPDERGVFIAETMANAAGVTIDDNLEWLDWFEQEEFWLDIDSMDFGKYGED